MGSRGEEEVTEAIPSVRDARENRDIEELVKMRL